jgi:hypothetical protein
MSQPIPADPNRDDAPHADADDVDTELAKREPPADPGADAAAATGESSATAGD